MKHIFVHNADATDLPLAIPVMDSKPTFDIDEVAEYYNDKIKIQDYDVTTALQKNLSVVARPAVVTHV